MRLSLLTSILFSFLISTTAIANLDCGNESISIDQYSDEVWTMDKIRALCGNPTKVQKWKEEYFNQYGSGFLKSTIHYTKWTYNRGSRTFIEYLLFKDGVLIDIKDGEYGTD